MNKSDFQIKIKLTIILLVALTGLGFICYLGSNPTKGSHMITSSVKIVNANDTSTIDELRNYYTPYAIKTQKNEEYFLIYFQPNPNSTFSKNKLDLTKEQFDKLKIGTDYWFEVKVKDTDVSEDGTVKSIYTENPMQR